MEPWPDGVAREIHAEVDSTSAELLRRAALGETGPLWLLARHQSAGRGRRGRGWQGGTGNFAASLLTTPDIPLEKAALRSFCAALAVADALTAVTGRPRLFSLKWPNDVLLGGGKLAGILLETGAGPGGGLALTVGIGVNLASCPAPETLEPDAVPPVSLADAVGLAVDPVDFLDCLAPAFHHWDARLSREGFAPIRAAWLDRAAHLGGPITARLPGRTIEGNFETIDAGGAIVLGTPDGRVTLPAADVHFGTARKPEGGDAHAAGH